MYKQKKWYTAFYVIMLINIVLILAYMIFSNTRTVNLDIDSWEIRNELELSTKESSDLLNSLAGFYNSDGGWYVDSIWCPTNIFIDDVWTLSWYVDSHMKFESNSWNCEFNFNSSTWKIFFSPDFKSFSWFYYDWQNLTINYSSPDYTAVWTDLTMNFSDSWISNDKIDDNFNDDNFSWDFYLSWAVFSWTLVDNDEDFSLNKVWKVAPSSSKNIFWSNYKIKKFLSGSLNSSYSWVYYKNNAKLFLTLSWSSLDYDIEVSQIDKNNYKNTNTIKVLNNDNQTWLNSAWIYINSWTPFDFVNNDYAIFLKNNSSWALLYSIKAEEDITWDKLFINPAKSENWLLKIFVSYIKQDWWKYVWKNKEFIHSQITSSSSKTCKEILDSWNSSGDWYYNLSLSDSVNIVAYCDMTTNGWGRTKYLDIKWNHSFDDALNCWLWDVVDNDEIFCFNPNRFDIDVTSLFHHAWNWNKYYYDINPANIWASTDTETTYTSNTSFKCRWHSEFMTIWTSNWNFPEADFSNVNHVWLWRSFCLFSVDPGWIRNFSTTHYFSDDRNSLPPLFWPSWWDWKSNSEVYSIYFR